MTVRESVFEQLRRIPEDLHEISDRLENWAAWSRDRIRQGHCRSIEYRYKTTDIHQDTMPPRAEWDSLDAAKVHSLVCGLPERYRWMLHLWVLHRAPEGYIRRALGIHRSEIVQEMHRAMRMVRNSARREV